MGNKPSTDQGKNKNQVNQGRNQGNQGRDPSQGRGQEGANLNPGLAESGQVTPYNAGEYSSQELQNVNKGMMGVGNPANPEESNMANAIKQNNPNFGNSRLAYFNSYKKFNSKARGIRMVNLACAEDKWKKYRSEGW